MIEELIIKFNILVNYLASLGPLAGFFLIVLESILPILPLGVFIAMNVEAFGPFVAYIVSYTATVMGCIISYYVFRYFLAKYYDKIIAKSEKRIKASKRMKKVKFSHLVLLLSLPFTPASLVNALCGVNKISQIKFISAILISKIFTIYFWVFVGKNFIDSLKNIKVMALIGFMLVTAYALSKIVSKKMDLE